MIAESQLNHLPRFVILFFAVSVLWLTNSSHLCWRWVKGFHHRLLYFAVWSPNRTNLELSEKRHWPYIRDLFFTVSALWRLTNASRFAKIIKTDSYFSPTELREILGSVFFPLPFPNRTNLELTKSSSHCNLKFPVVVPLSSSVSITSVTAIVITVIRARGQLFGPHASIFGALNLKY